jgi:hypothetical protein
MKALLLDSYTANHSASVFTSIAAPHFKFGVKESASIHPSEVFPLRSQQYAST